MQIVFYEQVTAKQDDLSRCSNKAFSKGSSLLETCSVWNKRIYTEISREITSRMKNGYSELFLKPFAVQGDLYKSL